MIHASINYAFSGIASSLSEYEVIVEATKSCSHATKNFQVNTIRTSYFALRVHSLVILKWLYDRSISLRTWLEYLWSCSIRDVSDKHEQDTRLYDYSDVLNRDGYGRAIPNVSPGRLSK